MKNTTMAHVLCLAFLLAAMLSAAPICAQEMAQTKSGKTVLLNPDGTWKEIPSGRAADTSLNPNAFRFFTEKQSRPIRLYCTVSAWTRAATESFRATDVTTAPTGTKRIQHRMFKISCKEMPEFLVGYANLWGGRLWATNEPGPGQPNVKKLYDLAMDGKEHKAVLDVRFKTQDEQKMYAVFYDPDEIQPFDANSVFIMNIVAIDTWEAPSK